MWYMWYVTFIFNPSVVTYHNETRVTGVARFFMMLQTLNEIYDQNIIVIGDFNVNLIKKSGH